MTPYHIQAFQAFLNVSHIALYPIEWGIIKLTSIFGSLSSTDTLCFKFRGLKHIGCVFFSFIEEKYCFDIVNSSFLSDVNSHLILNENVEPTPITDDSSSWDFIFVSIFCQKASPIPMSLLDSITSLSLSMW